MNVFGINLQSNGLARHESSATSFVQARSGQNLSERINWNKHQRIMPEHCMEYSWFASMNGNDEPISMIEAEHDRSAPDKIVDRFCEKKRRISSKNIREFTCK
jgi:hypothetical protein